jgi:hypothetical protein
MSSNDSRPAGKGGEGSNFRFLTGEIRETVLKRACAGGFWVSGLHREGRGRGFLGVLRIFPKSRVPLRAFLLKKYWLSASKSFPAIEIAVIKIFHLLDISPHGLSAQRSACPAAQNQNPFARPLYHWQAFLLIPDVLPAPYQLILIQDR